MKKLYETWGQRQVAGDYGLEIEVEGTNKEVIDPRWVMHHDGSLRGRSAEYVFKAPLLKFKVKPALVFLAKELEDQPVDFSFRTSVHVHMNVQQLTLPQYLNVLYTYLLLEEPFINYCGRERKGNRFCLRLQDAEGFLYYLQHLFRVDGFANLGAIDEDAVRYAAVNIYASRKYGSLEFRSMRGTLDVDVLTTWVEALDRLRTYAMKMEDPMAIHKQFMKDSPLAFMQSVLGDVSPAFEYPRAVRDMQRSFSLSLDLPYAYERSVEDQKNLEEKRKKLVNAPAPQVKANNEFDYMVKHYERYLAAGLGHVQAAQEAQRYVQAFPFKPRVAAAPLEWEALVPVNPVDYLAEE
jgi:hypothetical protein